MTSTVNFSKNAGNSATASNSSSQTDANGANLVPIDYFEYIDSLIDELKIPPDFDETLKVEIEKMVVEMVDELIMDTVFSAFQEKDFIKMDELLDNNPDLEESEAIFLIANEITGLPQLLMAALQNFKEEFTTYGDLNELVMKDVKHAETLSSTDSHNAMNIRKTDNSEELFIPST